MDYLAPQLFLLLCIWFTLLYTSASSWAHNCRISSSDVLGTPDTYFIGVRGVSDIFFSLATRSLVHAVVHPHAPRMRLPPPVAPAPLSLRGYADLTRIPPFTFPSHNPFVPETSTRPTTYQTAHANVSLRAHVAINGVGGVGKTRLPLSLAPLPPSPTARCPRRYRPRLREPMCQCPENRGDATSHHEVGNTTESGQ
ncbi:hypothetical protein B0H14DRAFT_2617827 [Mycena olivaceomarginata]|nr:hypothetical protein B0H14DRAFT_2617827 [Mycena olivaceomarginata]